MGTKTIGIAMSDPGRTLASPVSTISRRSVRDDCARIDAMARQSGADHVVVGLPFELDGSERRSARLARQVGAELAANGWRVSYVDERYSSVDATRQLIEAGLSREARRRVIDQAAAVIILQSFLDHPELEER